MPSGYHRRMMESKDPRYAKIAERLGYGTRRMQATQEVVEPKAPEPPTAAAPKEATPAPAPAGDDDIAKAREEYQRRVGKRPFNGWDAKTLRQKMNEAVKAKAEDDAE